MSAAKKKLNTDQVASELSESAFFQPTKPQVDKTTSTQVVKPTKPQVEKYTTHLRPGTAKAIKRYALEHDMLDYQVAQLAFDRLLQGGEAQPVVTVPAPASRLAAPAAAPQPLSDELVPLQAFADQHFVNRNEAERLRKNGAISAIKGTWELGAQRVTIALDAKGRRDFWIQFHETQGFRDCDDCPHK